MSKTENPKIMKTASSFFQSVRDSYLVGLSNPGFQKERKQLVRLDTLCRASTRSPHRSPDLRKHFQDFRNPSKIDQNLRLNLHGPSHGIRNCCAVYGPYRKARISTVYPESGRRESNAHSRSETTRVLDYGNLMVNKIISNLQVIFHLTFNTRTTLQESSTIETDACKHGP